MARGESMEIGEFPGLVNNADSTDIPDGAGQIQVNLTSRIFGEMTTRKGYRYAAFESTVIVTSLAAD